VEGKMSRRDYFREEDKLKRISIVFGIVLVLTILVFTLIFNLYNKKLREEAQRSILELGSINAVVPNANTLSASITEDKGVNEVKEENTTSVEKKEIAKHTTPAEEPSEEIVEETAQTSENEGEVVVQENTEEPVEEIEPKPVTFIAPVNGEIMKDFATETLVYSKTLDEWTVHNGIDIKAPKTTVVVASADGRVESIKNDPRYGLTVTISHLDGFKTVYSNLLTAEFVSEGQNVEQGRTIGTVGESASFEVVDEAHLHFEMTKDGIYVNPTLYFK